MCLFSDVHLFFIALTIFLTMYRTIIQWVIERDERVRNAQAVFDANQKEIARLQAFVDR